MQKCVNNKYLFAESVYVCSHLPSMYIPLITFLGGKLAKLFDDTVHLITMLYSECYIIPVLFSHYNITKTYNQLYVINQYAM